MITPIGMCQILAILAFMAGGSVRAQGAILCASWAASANLHHRSETTNGVSRGGIRLCQTSSIPNVCTQHTFKMRKKTVDIDTYTNIRKFLISKKNAKTAFRPSTSNSRNGTFRAMPRHGQVWRIHQGSLEEHWGSCGLWIQHALQIQHASMDEYRWMLPTWYS